MSNQTPTTEQITDIEQTFAFQARERPILPGYNGAFAALDTQRSRARGAFARLAKRIKGRPPTWADVANVGEAAGMFLFQFKREAWEKYKQHEARTFLDARFPSLNVLLWRLCQES